MSLWPNPAQESCTVELSGAEDLSGRWVLYGSTGQEVLAGVWPAGQKKQQIVLDDIVIGAYHFVLRTDNGTTAAQKLIVLS